VVLPGDGGQSARARREVTGQWRYLGWLLLFSAVSEVPYRLFIPDPDTLNVLPTLAGPAGGPRLAAEGASDRGLALSRWYGGGVCDVDVRFLWCVAAVALLLVIRRPGISALLPGRFVWRPINGKCCIAAAHRWRIPVRHMPDCALAGTVLVATCQGRLAASHAALGLCLYPVHFLLLLLVRQIAA
jgi:hypothetical protein